MALNTKHKALVAVLVLGAAGISVDRFLLSGATEPKPAAAENLLIQPGAAPTADRASETTSARVITVAQKLTDLPKGWTQPDAPTEADAFSVPTAWLAKIEEPKQPEPVAASDKKTAKATLHLTMIAREGGRAATAFINGHPLKLGDTVDGLTLIALKAATSEAGRAVPGSATLQGPDGQIELTLDPQS